MDPRMRRGRLDGERTTPIIKRYQAHQWLQDVATQPPSSLRLSPPPPPPPIPRWLPVHITRHGRRRAMVMGEVAMGGVPHWNDKTEVKQLYKQRQQRRGRSVVSVILISDPNIWVQMTYKLIRKFGFCCLRSLFEFSAGRF